MHPSLDHDESPDAETAALRQRIRLALARDLNLPAAHPAVATTMNTLGVAAHQHAAARATAPEAAAHATLDVWWCIVAHTHALIAR